MTRSFTRPGETLTLDLVKPRVGNTWFIWENWSVHQNPEIVKVASSQTKALRWANRRIRSMTRAGWKEVGSEN